MNIISMLLLIIYSVIGGASTLYLFFGMPVVIIWKIYRKCKFNIALTD